MVRLGVTRRYHQGDPSSSDPKQHITQLVKFEGDLFTMSGFLWWFDTKERSSTITVGGPNSKTTNKQKEPISRSCQTCLRKELNQITTTCLPNINMRTKRQSSTCSCVKQTALGRQHEVCWMRRPKDESPGCPWRCHHLHRLRVVSQSASINHPLDPPMTEGHLHT